MNVKAFLSKDGDEAMLEEGIKGEKAAVREYEDILDCHKFEFKARLKFLSETRLA